MKQLNSLVDTLKKKPTMKIEIAGHTDNVGEDLINLHLSQKRADAIRGYLLSKGIVEDRVLAKGYGETEPTASNDTQEGRSFNRRIEVKVIEE
jgi:outer membrane protein OmpA-like peptidoglycan-associated protein